MTHTPCLGLGQFCSSGLSPGTLKGPCSALVFRKPGNPFSSRNSRAPGGTVPFPDSPTLLSPQGLLTIFEGGTRVACEMHFTLLSDTPGLQDGFPKAFDLGERNSNPCLQDSIWCHGLCSPHPPRQPFVLGFCVHTQGRQVLESPSVVYDMTGGSRA